MIPGISFAALQAQGIFMQAQLYDLDMTRALVGERREDMLAIMAAIGATQPQPPQPPPQQPRGGGGGPAAAPAPAQQPQGGGGGPADQDEVEFIDFQLRRKNLAYTPRSGMLGRWALPEELAVGNEVQAEERMKDLISAIEDPGVGSVVGWPFGSVVGSVVGPGVGWPLGREGRRVGRWVGRWVGKVVVGSVAGSVVG